jgi:hypothetical protein
LAKGLAEDVKDSLAGHVRVVVRLLLLGRRPVVWAAWNLASLKPHVA